MVRFHLKLCCLKRSRAQHLTLPGFEALLFQGGSDQLTGEKTKGTLIARQICFLCRFNAAKESHLFVLPVANLPRFRRHSPLGFPPQQEPFAVCPHLLRLLTLPTTCVRWLPMSPAWRSSSLKCSGSRARTRPSRASHVRCDRAPEAHRAIDGRERVRSTDGNQLAQEIRP